MRAILINDTRSHRHVGCQLVVDNTLKRCREQGITVTHCISNEDAMETGELLRPRLPDNDLLLLNGEGTLHDDKPTVMALLRAAEIAKQAGLKTVLFNALWRNNPRATEFLSCFDLIYCRDSESARLVSEHAPCTMVPDMVFSTDLPEPRPVTTERVLVTDSVKKGISRSLARFAIRHAYPFRAIGPGFKRSLKSRPLMAWRLGRRCSYRRNVVEEPGEFIRNVLGSRAVVTGRFHAACIALLCGTPVACVSSNTPKIESLFRDFGLTAELASSDDLSLDALEKQWQEQLQQAGAISEKILRARQSIVAMVESFRE